jgi:predicted RNA-binding protein with PIN domain
VKQTLTALLVILLFAAIAVIAAEEATKKSAVDTFIAKEVEKYEKALSDANAYYKKYTAPVQKRCGAARDKRIITAGSSAIKRLTAARKKASEQTGARMEQEIEKIRKSIDEQVGSAPEVTPKVSVMAACRVSFKGHTYMAINSTANWKEANALCKKMRGHLAYIETIEELVFLAKAFRGKLWVGATDIHKEGDWRGNGKPLAKNLWFKNQPDNSWGGENYAILSSGKAGRMLNDVKSRTRDVTGFICEWE